MIQKISSLENVLKMVQNGPIRNVISIKAIFEDIFIFSPAVGHPCSTLRTFSGNFFKNHYDPIYQDWCLRLTW